MNPSHTISYEMAQSRIADLRHQARRESQARAARSEGAHAERTSRGSGIPRHLRLRHRVTNAAS